MNENVPALRGWVSVRGIHAATGKELFLFDNKNLITNLSKDFLGELLVQTLLSTARIPSLLVLNKMQLGDGTATPSRADTALQGGNTVDLVLTGATKLATGEYQVTETLSTALGNGITFAEVGLFVADPGNPNMIARQVHPAYAKDSSMTVQYTWTLIFS